MKIISKTTKVLFTVWSIGVIASFLYILIEESWDDDWKMGVLFSLWLFGGFLLLFGIEHLVRWIGRIFKRINLNYKHFFFLWLALGVLITGFSYITSDEHRNGKKEDLGPVQTSALITVVGLILIGGLGDASNKGDNS